MNFQFDSLSAFLHMDGHGVYVWVGYLLSIVVMLWLILLPIIKRREVLRQLNRELKRKQVNQSGGEAG